MAVNYRRMAGGNYWNPAYWHKIVKVNSVFPGRKHTGIGLRVVLIVRGDRE